MKSIGKLFGATIRWWLCPCLWWCHDSLVAVAQGLPGHGVSFVILQICYTKIDVWLKLAIYI